MRLLGKLNFGGGDEAPSACNASGCMLACSYRDGCQLHGEFSVKAYLTNRKATDGKIEVCFTFYMLLTAF
jgi:hypothetical protein